MFRLDHATWILAAMALGGATPGVGQATDTATVDWPAQKCTLYESAVKDAITLQGLEGLTMDFLTKNQVFIDNGCVDKAKICPMTDEEWKLADLLTKMTMNEGMASTFVPFGCP